MPIKKGDRLVHRRTGMKCKAVADEDREGLVMTKQKGGAFAPCPAADLDQTARTSPSNQPMPSKSLRGEIRSAAGIEP